MKVVHPREVYPVDYLYYSTVYLTEPEKTQNAQEIAQHYRTRFMLCTFAYRYFLEYFLNGKVARELDFLYLYLLPIYAGATGHSTSQGFGNDVIRLFVYNTYTIYWFGADRITVRVPNQAVAPMPWEELPIGIRLDIIEKMEQDVMRNADYSKIPNRCADDVTPLAYVTEDMVDMFSEF